MSSPRQRSRTRWAGSAAMVAGVVLNLYAGALAAFQLGGSCKELGFTVPTWNCRQASYYELFGVILFVGGVAAIAASFVRQRN